MTNELVKSASRDHCVDEVIAAYLAAVQAGESPRRDEWLARYPEFATDLNSFFVDQDHFNRLAAPLVAVMPTPILARSAGERSSPAILTRSVSEGSSLPPDDTAIIHPTTATESHRFGQYELLAEIGRGGMGVVYKARQLRPSRVVALKMILAGQLASPADVARFQSESEAAASLDHPHIVPIYEVGQCQSSGGSPPTHYFTMKLVEGKSLAERMNYHQEGKAPAEPPSKPVRRDLVSVLADVARAVHFAHQRGILHRDLKPANVLLESHNENRRAGDVSLPVPYITDFGLAKYVSADGATEQSLAIVGTASYMAPEQAAGCQRLTTAADIYSLGAILFEILTGRPPFREKTPLETMLLVREQEPASPRTLNSLLDRDIETICLKCLEKPPERRYASAAAFAEDLTRWLAGEPILARPLTRPERVIRACKKNPLVSLLTAAVVLVALTGLLGVLTQWQVAVANEQKALANEQKANEQRDEAQKQRDEVELVNKKLLAAQDKLKRMLYASDMSHAALALDSGATYRVRELLDKHRPKTGEGDQRGFEWFYLDRLSRLDLLTLQGHKGEVWCLAYSPDGTRLASGSDDKTVKIWDAQNGRELLTLTGHTGYIDDLAFSPDGARLVSLSDAYEETPDKELPREVIVWDAKTGAQLLTWSDAGLGYCVAFSPDGKRIANGSANEVKLRDSETGNLLLTVKALQGQIRNVVFSPDGKRLACVGGDDHDAAGKWLPGELKIFDAQTGQELLNLKGHTKRVRRASFSPDGKRLASASLDKTVRVWDAESGDELLTLSGHADQVRSVAFSPDGSRLATFSGDRSIKLWDAHSGDEIFTFKGQSGGYVNVVFSPDGRRLAAGNGWNVTVLDAETSEARVIETKYASGPVAYGPSGKRLATAGGDTAIIWDVESRKEILKLDHPALRMSQSSYRGIYLLAYSPDGKYVAIRGSRGHDKDHKDLGAELKVWDAQSGQVVQDFGDQSPRGASGLAFSPDSKRVAISGRISGERLVRMWDIKSGIQIRDFKWPKDIDPVAESSGPSNLIFAFSPDGRHIAATMPPPLQRLVIWNAETGEEVFKIGRPRFAGANTLVYSPLGDRLACASGNSVKIFAAQTGAEMMALKAHANWINDLAFSPDGKRLATGLNGGTVAIWDAEDGQELLSFAAENSSLLFSPDGQHLAISTSAGVRIVDASPSPPRPVMPPSKRFILDRPVVEGWYRAHYVNNDQPTTYEIALDSQVRHGGNQSMSIKSDPGSTSTELLQLFRADDYRGKRLRLTGYLKTSEVNNGFAGFVMRIFSDTTSVGFDYPTIDLSRQVVGTSDWVRREIVLDVPPESVSIVILVGFQGSGQIWADDLQIEVVGAEVPTTGVNLDGQIIFTEKNTPPAQAKPLNLDFER